MDVAPIKRSRITIIPRIHGKITRDGKMSEPDIYWIMERWLERHPEFRGRDLRVSRGRWTLPQGVMTEVITATAARDEISENYDPAQDADLYAYFLADERDRQ